MTEAISQSLKEHPVAVSMFALYVLVWLWLFYVGYYDYSHYGDGETTGMSIFGAIIVLFIPYAGIMYLLGCLLKQHQSFYKRMALLSAIPIPLILLWVLVLNALYH
jgi:hypothetical protein